MPTAIGYVRQLEVLVEAQDVARAVDDDVGGRDDAAGDDDEEAAEDERPALSQAAPEAPGREAAVADRRAHAHQGATRGGADVDLARTGHPDRRSS
jgi:hypothetical protein